MSTRRRFLSGAALATAGAGAQAQSATPRPITAEVSLVGAWSFRLDADRDWRTVTVPHTWQVEPAHADYYGVAWYRRTFDASREWSGSAVRVEFEAVFHTATVKVNGQPAGEHVGKGYTAFTLDIGRFLRYGSENTIEVRVDNQFNESMLPRGRSSDWAHDGGIYRPVRLLVTPKFSSKASSSTPIPTSPPGPPRSSSPRRSPTPAGKPRLARSATGSSTRRRVGRC